MRVKLCGRCPYLPCDLTGHYDPESALHLCAKCDDEREASTKSYPRKTYWRQKCAIFPNIVGMAQRSVARSVTESLVLSGTTPGEPPSVQRSALTNSGSVERETEDDYPSSEPPDNACSARRAAFSQSAGLRNKEVAQ
jgi:hypothetical protein